MRSLVSAVLVLFALCTLQTARADEAGDWQCRLSTGAWAGFESAVKKIPLDTTAVEKFSKVSVNLNNYGGVLLVDVRDSGGKKLGQGELGHGSTSFSFTEPGIGWIGLNCNSGSR